MIDSHLLIYVSIFQFGIRQSSAAQHRHAVVGALPRCVSFSAIEWQRSYDGASEEHCQSRALLDQHASATVSTVSDATDHRSQYYNGEHTFESTCDAEQPGTYAYEFVGIVLSRFTGWHDASTQDSPFRFP